ncbi:MAG: ABC transporter permease [Acidimicrobiales bacterium]
MPLRFPGYRSSHDHPPPLLLSAGGALVASLAVLPAVYLVVVAGQRGASGVAEVVLAPSTRVLLARSLGLAAAVTVSSAAVGTGLGWLMARCNLPGRRIWRVLCALPLGLPSYVTALAYTTVWPSAGGLVAAWFVLTLLCYPLVFLPVMAMLTGADPALEETARSLGDTRARTFLRVTLPQIRPAVAAGSLLVALFVASDFGAVSLLGVNTFTTIIYQSYLVGIDPPRGAVLGCVLLVFTLAIVAAEARTRGAARYHRSGGGPLSPISTGTKVGRWRWPALLAPIAIALLSIGVPVASMLKGLTDAGRATIDVAHLGRGLRGSVLVSSLGAAVTVAAAVPVSLLAARHRNRLSSTFERSTWVGHALPGVVVALSVAFFAVRFLPFLYRRLPVLVFAHVVLFLPLAVSALHARAVQVPVGFEETARSLGQRPGRVFRTVTGPLLAPGLGTGLVLVFLASLKELPATLLIGPFGFETLATQAWTAADAELGTATQAAVPSLVLVTVGALATALVFGRLIRHP